MTARTTRTPITSAAGPTALSLSAARANYLQHGACEPKFIPNVRPPHPEEMDLEYSI
jgi:hypothetical protein